MVHLTVHLVREVKLCGPIYLRWMFPFERYMKVIKNVVRNRNRPEGCIAEGYILEEAVEFCSEFLCGVDPIGLGCQKLRDNSDYSELGRPLSSGVTSIPERELLYQAHRYVLENTVDVQPYIEKHLIALQQQHRSRSKNQKWIQDEHNRTFISWLREKVETKLATGDVEVSDNLRWIAHGPHPVVTAYNSYAINGCHYHTKSHDKNKTVQNSRVSLVAKTMQVCSSKDKNLIIGEMYFYGVIEEIWELNYNSFKVAIFKSDWVENSGGIKTDKLGFVLVDLSRVGHNNDSFIFATQAKQVFFVEDSSDSRWSIVLTPPQRDFADQYNDDELGDKIHSYTMELPTDEDLTLGLDEVEIGLDNAHTDHLEQVDASKNEKKKTRGLILMHDVTRIKSTGEKTVVEYNENGIPIGENGHKLQSFIGSCVHHHIPITHASWKGAFVVDGRSKKAIMKTAGVSFRQFKSWLTTQYIIPFMDEPQLLIDPPSLYAHIIDKPIWQEFVRSRMSSEFHLLSYRRKRSKYTHNISRRDNANLAEDMVIKNVIVFYKYILKFNYGVLNDIQKKGSFEEQDFGRANMWKKARTKKDGGYINEDVQQVANEIILDKAPNEELPNDALTQALGTPEYGRRVRGVGGFITPTVYFHQAKPRKSKKVDTTQQIIDENEALRKRIRELEQKVQSIPTSKHGSCSKSKVQEKEVKEEEVIATTSMTKNEVNVKVKSSRPMTKEVEVTSEPSNLPIQLKYILRYDERVMVDGSSFSFQLPLELFGISRKSYVLREDVIDFCNMQKFKTLSMVSKYVFVDPSLISAGYSTREIRTRNLCSRLMTSKQDQLVVAPYNPGDHWSLVIINPYDDVVYHLDSLRTSSRDDIKYVGTVECRYYVMRYMREILSKDTSIIVDAIDTRNSYSQLELDEVRVEWAEFLSRYI
ncbi:hypothetical protein IC582_004808 [Cucumis melo]